MSRAAHVMVWIGVLAVAMTIWVRAADAPPPPLPPLPEGTMVAVHVDLARLDLGSLGGPIKMMLPPEAAAALAQADQKVQEALKAGVISVTGTFTLSDINAEGSPTVFVGLKEGADPAAAEKVARGVMTGDPDGSKMELRKVGGFLVAQPKGQVTPAAMAAAAMGAFNEGVAAATANKSPIVIVAVPNDVIRAQFKAAKASDNLPPPLAAMMPALGSAKWMELDVTLGAAPALNVALNAADESAAKEIVQHATELLEMGKAVLASQPDAKANPQAAATTAAMFDMFKPTQTGSQVKVSIGGPSMMMAAAVLLPALNKARGAAEATTQAATTATGMVATSSELQPLSADLDFLPPPAPWQVEKSQSGADKAAFTWNAGGKNILPGILVWNLGPAPSDEAAKDFAKQMAEGMRGQVGGSDGEVVVQPEALPADGRFVGRVHYTVRKDQGLVDTMIFYRKAGTRLVMVTAIADGDIEVEKKTRAIDKLAEDVALSVVPHGRKPEGSIVFDTKPLGPPTGSATGVMRSGLSTPPPMVKGARTGSTATAATPAAATAAPAPTPAVAKPAPAPEPAKPNALAAARQLKGTNPADAYAAFKAIIKASPGSADATAAGAEITAMEGDALVSRKILNSEGKAYSALSMAQNFQNSGQADKAKQRYEQVMKDFPDTLSASIAKKRIDEIEKAGEKK
jgi:hypothetical protein